MKNEIRNKMKEMRKAMHKNDVFEKSQNAQNLFLKSKLYNEAEAIMLYMPLGNEMSTVEMIKKAHSDGKTVLVPVMDGKTFEITAHRIYKDSEFEKGVFSLTEPIEKSPFDISKINLVIVPGVAFSKTGERIGFGKGCYDKFLKDSTAIKVGFCYDYQLTDEIITDDFDIKMDYLVTEKEIINCKTEHKR